MNACELTTALTVLANSLACGRTTEEVTLLGTIFVQLGDTLQTIAARMALCEGK